MLHDYTGNDSIASGTSSGTLDLNGNTFTSLSSDQMVQINYDNAGITIRNGTLTGHCGGAVERRPYRTVQQYHAGAGKCDYECSR